MPPKTDRRHRQGQESRTRILEAALAIAAERGYDGTTVALITEHTGLPASSIYWQFRNKDELLAEALDHSFRAWRSTGPTWQPANYTGSPRERIVTRLRSARLSVEEEPEFWRLGLMLAMLRRSGTIAAQERFLQVRRETQLIIEEWWRTVLSPTAAADAVICSALTHGYLAIVDGMFVAHRADPTLSLSRLVDVMGEAFADVAEEWSEHPTQAARRLAAPGPTQPSRVSGPPTTTDDPSRERLLVAAAEIAAERGYRGTTISRVCARAELPVSSVYWFFADKDELLAEVVQHSWDGWSASQPDWAPPRAGESWSTALTTILEQAVQSLIDAPSFIRIGIMLTLERQGSEAAARVRFLEVRAGIRDRITGWFAANLPPSVTAGTPAHLPQVLADAVIAFTDGYFLGSQIDVVQHESRRFVTMMVDVLVAAVSHAENAAAEPRPRRKAATP